MSEIYRKKNTEKCFTREEITEQTIGYEIVQNKINENGDVDNFLKIKTPLKNKDGDEIFAFCRVGDYILREADNTENEYGCLAVNFDAQFEKIS